MDWKLLSPWLLLWIGSFQPSCWSWSSLTCCITASYLKYIKFSLHCSMMISYLTRSFYGYEISGFYCYEDFTRTNIFLLPSVLGILHLSIFQDICIYIFFSRKIKLFPSRIFQILLTGVSRTILWLYDRRICLLSHKVLILFLVLNYFTITEEVVVWWTLTIKMCILIHKTSQEYLYTVSAICTLTTACFQQAFHFFFFLMGC